MKVVLGVVLDKNFWDEKRHFHPNLDESVLTSQGQPPSMEGGLAKTRNANTPNFSATTGVVWSSLFWRQEEGRAKRPSSSCGEFGCVSGSEGPPFCNTLRHSRGGEGGPGCSLVLRTVTRVFSGFSTRSSSCTGRC